MIIENGLVFDGTAFVKKNIFTEGERFSEATSDDVAFNAANLYVLPGLTDIHFHGAAGCDFCDGTEESIQKIADYEACFGVLSVCPATMTLSEERLKTILEAAANHKNEKGADLVGVNLEGPFISEKKIGAQNEKYLLNPDISVFYRLDSIKKGLIKLVDVAPELNGCSEFINKIKESVKVSLAHTDIDYDGAIKAFDEGASHMTHMFNAMNGISHRNPGPIIAAKEKNATVELICDGVHVHPAVVRMTFEMFGSDKVVLVSDSMEATGLGNGEFSLGGKAVCVSGNKAFLKEKEGVIAGSVTNLFDCMKKAIEFGVPKEKAVMASTINPAKAIGIDKDYGSIDVGKYANMVIVDENFNIMKVIRRGKYV